MESLVTGGAVDGVEVLAGVAMVGLGRLARGEVAGEGKRWESGGGVVGRGGMLWTGGERDASACRGWCEWDWCKHAKGLGYPTDDASKGGQTGIQRSTPYNVECM